MIPQDVNSQQQERAGATYRLVGITGGFGAGKSTVAGLIAERYPVLDSDRIARDLMERDAELRRALARQFGDDLFAPGIALDRAGIAARVFSDPEQLASLNRIVHPRVMTAIASQAAAHAAEGRSVIFVESALIFEAGLEHAFFLTIAVLASEETVLRRARERARYGDEDAQRRIARQMDPEEKASRADFTIRNEDSMEGLRSRVDLVLRLVEALCRRGR